MNRGQEATGFTRMKPFLSNQVDYVAQLAIDGSTTALYKAHIQKEGPYRFFITLTFGSKVSEFSRSKSTDYLVHIYNQLLFGGAYRKNGNFIQGYAFFEDHRSPELHGLPHVHLLVKDNERFDVDDFDVQEGIFRTAVSRVRHCGRSPFNTKYVDIQKVRDNNVIGYCTKQISDRTINRIKPFGKYGLSDCLWHNELN